MSRFDRPRYEDDRPRDRYDDRDSDRGRYDRSRYDDRDRDRGRYDDRDRDRGRYDDRDRDRGRYDDRDRDRGRYDDRRDREYRSRNDGRDRYDRDSRRYDDRRGNRDRDGPNKRLHLANLSQDAKYDDIQRYFETYGRVLNVDVKEGFGFVEFDNHRAARDAMEALDKKEFMGTELKVSFAKTPKPKFTAKGKGKFKVAFENLSESTSWQDLKDFARQAGECTQSHVKVESNGTKSGSVEFLHLEDYEKAIKILKDATFKGNVVRLVEEKCGPVENDSASGNARSERSRSPAYRGRSSRSPMQYSRSRSGSPAGRTSARSPLRNDRSLSPRPTRDD